MENIRNTSVPEEFHIKFVESTPTHILWKYINDWKLHKSKINIDKYGRSYIKVKNRHYYFRELGYMTPNCCPQARELTIVYVRNGERLMSLISFYRDRDFRDLPYNETKENLLRQYGAKFI